MQRSVRRRNAAPRLVAVALLLACPAASAAQKRPAPEFTRQSVLVPNFLPREGADRKLGRRAGDLVRSRLEKLIRSRDVDVIDGRDMRLVLLNAGFAEDATLGLGELRALGLQLRSDEYVMGSVARAGGTYRMGADLVLVRNEKLRQPLPVATGARLEDVADQLAKAAAAARTQFVHQRRCENALREGRSADALASARQGVAAYAQSTIARTCLVWALRATRAPATEVLSVAQQILAIDSIAAHALESAAIALDSLRRRPEAASMWLRLARTDSFDLDLVERVSYALIDGGNSRVAEDFLAKYVGQSPDHLPLVRQLWRAAFENRSWTRALTAGELLLAKDDLAKGDSSFHLRLATVYRASNKPFHALGTLSRAVIAFPADQRLYALYTEYVRAEADTALPRGLALFPTSPGLLAIHARELRARGKLQESLDATRRLVSVDSSVAQGQLTVAQLEMELGRPDSALVALHRALERGEDTAVVSQFALSKGNALYRAASGTGASADFALALRFVALGDSLRASPQSNFLLGATALAVAHAALTEAPKAADKIRSCELAQLGAGMLPVAKAGLTAGLDVSPDAAKQSLDHAGVLDPYATQQVSAFCAAAGTEAVGNASRTQSARPTAPLH